MDAGGASPLRPAPWTLAGSAWIVALRLPARSPARRAFLAETLRDGFCGLSFVVAVNYEQADCGPYRELLFIPGAFRFSDGRRHPTVSRILVSTEASAVNGRRNWGLPKEVAAFELLRDAHGEERLVVTAGSCLVAELRARASPIRLPIASQILPRPLRTLAQRSGGTDFFFTPSGTGVLQPGRVTMWRCESDLFPADRQARIVAAARLSRFTMHFPEARVAAAGG
jgi:hypothetical protein